MNWILSRTSGTPFTVGTSGTSVNAPGNTQTADQILPTVADSRRPRRRPAVFRSERFRAGHRRPLRQHRPQHPARSRRLQPGRQPFPRFHNDRAVCLAVPRRSFGVTNTPQFGNPGATVSSATRNADGSIGSERLRRNHQRHRRTAVPVRAEVVLLAGGPRYERSSYRIDRDIENSLRSVSTRRVRVFPRGGKRPGTTTELVAIAPRNRKAKC